MGNNHCNSSYSRNNWNDYHNNDLYDGCYDDHSLCGPQVRTHPNFTGAIGRLVGVAKQQAKAARQEAKEIRKQAKARAKEIKKQAKDSVRNLSRSHSCQTGNNSISFSSSLDPIQNRSISCNQYGQRQIDYFAPITPHSQPSSNMVTPSSGDREGQVDNEPLTLCRHCDDMVLSRFYEDHIRQCGPNVKQSCEFCGGMFKRRDMDDHKEVCDARVENIKINCDHCNTQVPLVSLHYHASTCPQNPKNIVEVEECAICLLEIKKDGDVKFLHCAHNFHTKCIEEWSQKKKSCPVCMTEFN